MHRYFPRRVTADHGRGRPATTRGGSKVLRAAMAAELARARRAAPPCARVRKRESASTSGNSGTPRSSHGPGDTRYGDPSCHSEDVPCRRGRTSQPRRVTTLDRVMAARCVRRAPWRLADGSCGSAHRVLGHAGLDRGRAHDAPRARADDHDDAGHRAAGDPGAVDAVRRACSAASVAVPLDYAHPQAGTIQIALAMHPATDPAQRIGSLVINPGGPGASGVNDLPAGAAACSPPSSWPASTSWSSIPGASSAAAPWSAVPPESRAAVDTGAASRPRPEHCRRPAGPHRQRQGVRGGSASR